MRKESLFLLFLRIGLLVALLAVGIMLYWSSLLIEQDLKVVSGQLNVFKTDLANLRADTDRIRDEISRKAFTNSPRTAVDAAIAAEEDTGYENLLHKDPFYETTLPKLLGPDFKPHGVRRQATIGKPQNLMLFSGWYGNSIWNSLCTISVAASQFGKYETYAPAMATRMELRHNAEGLPEYWIFLRKDVFWAPLEQKHFPAGITLAPQFLKQHPVTAHDFKFYYDAFMNPHVQELGAITARTNLGDISGIEVVDDYTMIVRWKTKLFEGEDGQMVPRMKYRAKLLTGGLSPLASFVFKYFYDGTKIIDDSDPEAYRSNPIWAQNFSHHWANNIIVSCGPWLFDGMTEREIRFKRNKDFFRTDAALCDNIEERFKDTQSGVWEEFKAGTIDFFEMPPSQVAELDHFLESDAYLDQAKAGLKIKRLDYPFRAITYVGWNQTKRYFKSRKVRQALTMAIDRKRIIQRNLNGLAIEVNSDFFRFSPAYDPSIIPWPYDPLRAKALLAEEGWYDSDGDGIIDKEIDGKRVPFVFALTYYVKNAQSKAISEYIATALKEVGIVCELNGVDIADLSASVEDKSFDALYLSWTLGSPPEDPNQLWHSQWAKVKGSSNHVGFVNQEADAIIEQLEYEYNPEKRIALYHRFAAILHEEAPYTFLYTPMQILLYREYLQNVFLPVDRQDLIPGANVAEPSDSIYWIKSE